MVKERADMAIFGAGVGLMLAATITGKLVAPDVDEQGMIAYITSQKGPGVLKALLFAFGFPLGVGVSVIGAALLGRAPKARAALFAALAFAGVLLAILVPAIFGGRTSPGYFGTGGVLILALIATVLWFWAHYRRRLPERSRPAADLQAAGYLFFAFAAWNLCGVGGMPGYALYPDKMLQFNAHPFAVGQLKVVMACLVLGWLFTALGFYHATRKVK